MKTSRPYAIYPFQSRNHNQSRLLRKAVMLAFAVFLLSMMSAIASAQVSVTATAGTVGPTPYTTVKGAFDAINAGTHQGAITIDITANTTEGTTPATLNSSGAGLAVYTSVLLRPTVDGVSISGNPVTGFGVIQLNGADNVTIDGDNPNTGGINRDLTVSNTTTTTVIANSAIRIATSAAVTSADSNTIKNCILLGNVTAGNSAAITVTTGSSNSSFGIYVGGNGGATATGAPTAITSVTANTAPAGTTINGLTIDNNSVNQCARAIVFNGAATSVSSGVAITNNVVGDQGTPTPATPPFTTPATTVYTKGVWVAGTNSVTVTGNTLKNIMSYVGTTITTVELVSPIGTTAIISNNTITNPTNNGTVSVVKGILVSNATGTLTISSNTISNVQDFAAASGTAGIDDSAAGVTGATIELNKITTVYDRSISTFGAWGLNVGAGNNVVVRNNFISDVKMDMSGGLAFSTTFGIHGIRIAAGTGHKVYHNSVNLFGTLFGTATTAILTSACTIASTVSTGVDFRNNICSNTLSGGTTSIAHVSIFLPSGGTSAMNLTLNNNGYYFGTDAARQGVGQAGTIAGTNFFTTLAALKAYSSTLSAAGTNDNASFATTTAAPFTSSSDLHIPNGTTTPLESAGASGTGVTVDIDLEVRNVTTPDIGADEFSGIFIDLTPPGISYAPLINTSSTSNRSFTGVTITDGSGVNTTPGTKPRVYYKKSTDTNDSAGWKFVEANGTTSPFDFTINYSLLNGGSVTAGDVIQYFVVAQDLAATPNVGINSGTFAAQPSSVALTAAAFPIGGTINSYRIATAFSGSLNVGTAETITSLTNASGLFETLNNNVLSGNLTVNITSDLAVETGTFSLNQLIEEGVGGYTVTIQPSGGARVVSGSNATVLINLNGADRVTFNGVNAGGNSLTLRNTNAATGSTVRLINDASNNNLLNCIFEQGNGSTTILFSTGVTTGNDNNVVSGNIIRDRAGVPPFNGFFSGGTSAAVSNGNNVLDGNQIVNFTQAGLIVAALGNDNWTVTNNDISQTANRTTVNLGMSFAGLGTNLVSRNAIHDLRTSVVGGGTGSTFGIILGDARNTTVSLNRIYNFPALAGGTGRLVGIEFDGASATPASVTLVNNMISIVTSVATVQSVFGIFDFAFGGNTFTADHNSVYVGGTSGAAASWGLVRGTLAPDAYTARNNIVYNNRTGGGVNHFAGGDQSANTGTFISNFNFFAGTGTTPANFMDYGTAGAGTPVSFAAWQTGPPARDANSVAGTAASFTAGNFFVNQDAGDLHLKPTATPVLSAGTPLGSVTSDFDNDPRPAANPDIGADELVQAVGGVIPGGTFYNASAVDGDSLGGNVTITNVLYLGGKLSTGAFTLTIECNATVQGASATSFIIGNLRKNYCATGVKGFEVGTANGYSPVSVNVTAGTFPASFTVTAVQGPQPNVNPATSLQRYWTLTEGGDVTANLQFNYLDPPDVMGTEANYHLIRVTGGNPQAFPNGSCPIPAPNTACVDIVGNQASINDVTNFSDWTLGEISAPTAAPATISGQVTTTSGAPMPGVTMLLSGARSARTITDINGNYRFQNVDTDNFYTVAPARVNYRFSPPARSFSLLANKTDAAFTGTLDDVITGNVIDTPEYFVRQHYLDFLGREPDQSGLNFWSDQILGCGNDFRCVERRTINVSAAYFISIEFQETGGMVDGLYQASYGRAPSFNEFMPDTATIAHNLIVGETGWQELLRTNKQEFLDAWVQRAAFRAAYDNLSDDSYVDALIRNTGVSFTDGERAALVSGLTGGTLTRAGVLQQIAQNEHFVSAKFNERFVRMQYFGYLRRDPDDSGFHFWLNKLNEFNGNFEQAEMVKAFLVSGEYRDRFRQ